MEYEKLFYINERGETLEFSDSSVFHCNIANDVTGLADVSNTLYTVSSMGQNGDTFVSQRIEQREIEITGSIDTKEKDRVLELRRKMQKILNPGLSAKLMYVYKDFIRVIDCKTESAPSFRRKSVFINYTISLVCCDPFWKEQNETRKEVAAWVNSWEFPFEIPEEGMELGYREPSVIVNVINDGDVKCGMRIVFKAKGTLTNPELINLETREYIRVNTEMEPGDIITINTEYGKKGASLTREEEILDYFRFIDVDSTFMELETGDNIFRYAAQTGEDLLEVTIYHNNRYLGV